jgi:glucose/mannose-6-phosphate isomerase
MSRWSERPGGRDGRKQAMKREELESPDDPRQPRLARLASLLGPSLFDSVLWGHEYDASSMPRRFVTWVASGTVRRIVFYGMGCSSVVSDAMKGFIRSEGLPYAVDVVNDYESEWFVDDATLADPATLVVIVCYSGWSVEPCLFLDRLARNGVASRTLVLSGGGKIAARCREEGVALVQYQLRHADREYPLYHVQQFLAIFIDLFHRLGLVPTDGRDRLARAASCLRAAFTPALLGECDRRAARLEGAAITFLSTARWNGTLLKQVTMFFNEIAMVPAHRHLLHEWSHTEVAAFSDPARPLAIVAFTDPDEDEYTRVKVATMREAFGRGDVAENRNVRFEEISLAPPELDRPDFLTKYLYGNFLMMHVAFRLGLRADVAGRDLIATVAGNPWWSQAAIERHPRCVDIPSELGIDAPDRG